MSTFAFILLLILCCLPSFLCANEDFTESSLKSDENIDYEEENLADENPSDFAAKAPKDASEFMDYIEEMIKGTKSKLEEMLEKHLPRILQMSTSVTLSPRCTHDLLRVLFGLREMKPWAIKCKNFVVLDASGKLPDGVLHGTFTSLGNYDECLDIKLYDDRFNETELTKGQYCGLSIAPLLPPKPQSASIERVFNEAADAKGYPKESVCLPVVPSQTSPQSLPVVSSDISNNLRVNVTLVNCEVKEEFHWKQEQLVTGGVIAALFLLVALSTAVDICWTKPQSNSYLRRFCVSFSAYSNSCELLSTKLSEETIKPLYGLRVLSLIWVILANSYVTLDLKLVGNLLQTREVNSQLLFQAVINASLAIETFFFISGLLIAFVTLKKLKSIPWKSWKPSNWLWFYFRRWVRLTPGLMLVIALVLVASPLNDGPLWKEIISPSAERCRRNWWIHFLHISNFFDTSEMYSAEKFSKITRELFLQTC
ncbi:nose resistant to fluoxetine protein 6-like protein [Leptotrombidium deliense]|uniref:Nose resistant to fluoxetine protein 6-like protein n=1 Tax=Leptotrombidium deliense TaxID=299467 RepID=A0A443SNY6_9ACAR|nr:nose resistant to fluoxetine protein 6-like protein [Leptotrombidium deliense]